MRCGRQCYTANEVRPQLDELLVSSVEGVSVEGVSAEGVTVEGVTVESDEMTDTVVRVEARTTVRQTFCPGRGYSAS
ncbi:hypothetical protein [Streptomyces phaeochromogenes]|uniref:hypothetical protein n=1 Tax=Streptomyces phaeochromogenes TaxID=1923 RepID=UPI0036B0CD74